MSKSKKVTIEVQGTPVVVLSRNEQDIINLGSNPVEFDGIGTTASQRPTP